MVILGGKLHENHKQQAVVIVCIYQCAGCVLVLQQCNEMSVQCVVTLPIYCIVFFTTSFAPRPVVCRRVWDQGYML